MEIKEFKQFVKSKTMFLIQDSYRFKSASGVIWFEKKVDDIRFRITVNISLGSIPYRDICGVFWAVSFNIIEYYRGLVYNQQLDSSNYNHTIIQYFDRNNFKNYQGLIYTEVNGRVASFLENRDEQDLGAFCEAFEDISYKEALPFLKKYETLVKLYDYLKDKNDWRGLGFEIEPLKIYIIKSLFDKVVAEQYFQVRILEYQSWATKGLEYGDDAKKEITLFEKAKSIMIDVPIIGTVPNK